MTLPAPTITAYLDLPVSGGDFFTLDDPVKGVLDNTTYRLAGDLGTDLSGYGFDVTIRRGRATHMDHVSPGTCEIAFRNHTRDMDALNSAGPFFGFLKPGRPLEIDMYGQRLYTGNIDDWRVSYDVSTETTTMVPVVDGLGLLARRDFDEWTTTAGDLSGERITAALNRDEIGWPGGLRDIGSGVATLQADLVTWGSNALNYLQLVAESEHGIIFCDRTGVLTFRDRNTLVAPSPVVTFADDGSGLDFHGATLSAASAHYYNRVGVDREGGTLQTVVDEAMAAQDGYRSLTITGLLMDSDEQSLGLAELLLSIYKAPRNRVETITVNLLGLDAVDRPPVAALDIYDVIHVTWTPNAIGSAIDEDMVIEGIDHSIPFDGCHLMTFRLSPVTQFSVFTLDDPVLGVLDGPGLLAFS